MSDKLRSLSIFTFFIYFFSWSLSDIDPANFKADLEDIDRLLNGDLSELLDSVGLSIENASDVNVRF